MNSSYRVKITSKNQITLPSKMMRDFKLRKGGNLVVRPTTNGIELRPEPSLRSRMQDTWQKIAQQRSGKLPLSEDALDNAARDIWASQQGEL